MLDKTPARRMESDQGDLRVETVDSFDRFQSLRPAWERLERRDVEATVFLSWAWLAQAFRSNPWRWSVLVVHDPDRPGELLAALPLKYRLHWSRSRQQFQSQIEAGGRLLFSEYTGFLCDPARERPGLAALAAELARLPWARFSMRYVAQTRRARFLTDRLKAHGLEPRYRDYRINKGQTDNLVCPQVELPEDFDSYLNNQISANTRQRLNRVRRRHLETGEYRFTHAGEATLEADLSALLGFWVAKWAPEKGHDTALRVAENYAQVLLAAQHCGALFLPMLCRGETRLGGLGHVIDRRNGILHFIVAGRDIEAEERFIGEALHFHSIAWAIEQGFVCYDFGHGNERYKYSYGAEDLQTVYFDLRRAEDDPAGVLDVINLGAALRRIEGYIATGKHERAARACAQLAALIS